MAKRIVAIVGTYRRNHVIETAVDELLRGAAASGAETEKVMLIDAPLEFCTNCRACMQTPGPRRGKCIHDDSLGAILDRVEAADAVVLAGPINFGTATAVMKRFIERLVVYGFWPWGNLAPKNRIADKTRRAVLVTSSACPAALGRILMRDSFRVMKQAAETMGAKVADKIYFGGVARQPEDRLNARQMRRAFAAGEKLAAGGNQK